MKKIIFLMVGALLIMAQPVWAAQKLMFSTINGLLIVKEGERLLQQAYQPLNISISVQGYPGERSLVDANSGKTDGELGRIAGLEKEYPNLIMVPVPLMELSESAFSNKEINFQKVNDLKKYRVGYVGGSKIDERMTAGFPHRLPVSKPEQLFHMLMLNRIDVAIHTTEDGLLMLQSGKYKDVKIVGTPLVTAPVYHYLNKKHADLVPKITKSLQDMTDQGVFKKAHDDFLKKLQAPP